MELLAYHDPERGVKQSLKEHLEGMLSLYEELFLSRRWHLAASRRTGVSGSHLDGAVRLAIVFHDVGKAYYADRIFSGGGAPLHEAYSALTMKLLMPRLAPDILPSRVYEAAMWAVLMHHLSMGRPELYGSGLLYQYARGRRAVFEAEAGPELAGALERLVENLLGYPVPLSEVLREAKYRLRLSDLPGIYLELKGRLGEMYPVALRLLRVLIVVDNIDASRARGAGDLRVFVRDFPAARTLREAMEAVEGWLGK